MGQSQLRKRLAPGVLSELRIWRRWKNIYGSACPSGKVPKYHQSCVSLTSRGSVMYQWLVFAHVLGVFGFLLAHGTAAAVAFALPRQREVERVRVLLDLSRGVTMVANVSLLVLLAAGITAGFMGNWWSQGWIWTALGLLVLMSISMSV